MRIIAGRLRGRELVSFQGAPIRPTTDRVKGSLFNRLQGLVDGARVLDLYSGTGNLAFEALSRGASEAVSVEKHRQSLRILRANQEKLGLAANLVAAPADSFGRHIIVPQDVILFLNEYRGVPFDLILIDPPFTEKCADTVMGVVASSEVFGPDTQIVIESSQHEKIQDRYGQLRLDVRKSFGDKLLSFFVVDM